MASFTMSLPPRLRAVIIFFTSTLFSLADGCYRRSTRPMSTTPPPSSTINPSHKVPCTQAEQMERACENGGQCFAVLFNEGVRSTGCSCPSMWKGERCLLRDIDPEILAIREENMRTAHIAAGVSVCILVVFVVLLAVYVYVRARRKDRNYSHEDHESRTNGTASGRPLNGHRNGRTSEARGENEREPINNFPVNERDNLSPESYSNEDSASIQPFNPPQTLGEKETDTGL